ncbi:hypothetical protein PGIGA_G00173080 [Pangasianodon gigas]|uniref:Uncharacterized protein n=1 Tax=Pangasianodon gigas TaxID=30993 RepID=A0ACC5XU56_PANGG|nr:hypothetical protein [Pangasianodon gigas]
MTPEFLHCLLQIICGPEKCSGTAEDKRTHRLQKPAAATGTSSVESFSVHEIRAVTGFSKLWREAEERAVAKEEERVAWRK